LLILWRKIKIRRLKGKEEKSWWLGWLKYNIFTGEIPRQNPTEQRRTECETGRVKRRVNEEGKEG
jgi:hypothetical protein